MFDNFFDEGTILDEFDYEPEPRKRNQPSGAKVRRKLRYRALDALGGECKNCGFSDYRALEIDHVHNNGKEEREKLSHPQIYRKVIKHVDSGEYQCLCANCHRIKTHEALFT